MGRPPLDLGTHGAIRLYPHPHPDGSQWRATTKFRGHDGVTRPISRIGKSKAAAERALKAAIARHQPAGHGALTGATRFADAAQVWLDEIARLRRGTTHDTYRRYLQHRVLPALGALQLREITVPVVHRYLRALEVELKPNTVRGCRKVVSGVLGLAVQHGALPTNPVRDAGRIEGSPSVARALTRAERVEFFARIDADPAARERDLPDLFRYLLGTGVRIGEALGLQWGRVDLDERVVVHGATLVPVSGKGLVLNRPKSDAGWRVVPLPDFVAMMLHARRPADADPAAPVFPNTLGRWRDPAGTQTAIRAARKKAGFEWLTSHVFRKTAITIMDEQRLTPREIGGHVGHARPSITQDTYMDRRLTGRATADALEAGMRPEG